MVRQAAELAGCPVVLENLARQVLAYDAAGDSAELLLDGWEQHSRRVAAGAGAPAYDPDTGWLVTTVGARGPGLGPAAAALVAGGTREPDAAPTPAGRRRPG